MSDLKPCPFCGETCIEGPRAEHIERAAGYGYTVYNVGHSQLSAERTKCITWATAESPEEAIERWNRRTQPEAAAPAVPSCRMQGGICACRSGGSFGGCAIERGIVDQGFVEKPTAPAQDLSAAILAIKLPDPQCYEYGGREPTAYSAKQMRDLLKAAAALASSANALSAGDRVDAELSKYLRHLPDCGSWVKEVDTYDENDMWSGTTNVSRPCTCGLDAILQSQKGGSHG